MNVVDLFAGTGAATQPFLDHGDRVTRVDLRAGIDVRSYHPPNDIDFIWASPPCDEFSRYVMPWHPKTNGPPSLELVFEALRVIREAEPRYWVLENVVGAQRFIGRAPYHWGPYYLWGFYPQLQIDGKPLKKMRIWGAVEDFKQERSRIPEPLAQAVHRSVCLGPVKARRVAS